MPACITQSDPALLVEEDADSDNIDKAINELKKKFSRNLPHYGVGIQWIIGIAIGGDQVTFGRIHRSTDMFTELASFDLSHDDERLGCVHAAINVARWCKWVRQSKLLHPLPAELYDPVSKARCSLSFSPPNVHKVMLKGCWNSTMKDFYSQVARGADASNVRGLIPHLEWATCPPVENRHGELQLILRPLGVPRAPEAHELRGALRCILTAVSALHSKEWAHLDLRWPNVVWCGDENWVVIDAEFALRFGSPMPSEVLVQDTTATTVDDAADLFLVGRMIEAVMKPDLPNAEALQSLMDALLGRDQAVSRERRKAAWALNHAYFRGQ